MNTVITAGQIAGAILAMLTLVGVVIKWAVVKPIKLYIDQATYPIQPHSNGGRSLPDAITAINDVKTMLNDHLDEHRNTPK